MMAPPLGFEPRTDRLTGGHSTIELQGNVKFFFEKLTFQQRFPIYRDYAGNINLKEEFIFKSA